MILFETERLSIKSINPKDVDSILKIYNKPENMRYVSSGKSDWTKDELLNKFEKANAKSSSGIGIYTIELKEPKQIIGEAALFNSFENLQKLELGYIIDSSYWGKGYGTEVCCGLIKYSFVKLNVKTLVARMYSKNKGSVALSEKCGMTKTDSGLTEHGEEYVAYSIENKSLSK